jgi:RNA polymerase sigma-70 factor (ECF subfamily)
MSEWIKRTEIEDSLLVKRFKNGDQKAFNLLVERYKRNMYNLILKMVCNSDDAKDLSQEVFVKAYQGLNSFEGKSSFYTWLYKIALNLCLNFSRREKFRSFISIFELPETHLTADSSMTKVDEEKLSLAIDKAVLDLPPKQRMVFVLRYYHQTPFSEIAQILGKTEGGVKANYFQAIKKLRKALAWYA